MHDNTSMTNRTDHDTQNLSNHDGHVHVNEGKNAPPSDVRREQRPATTVKHRPVRKNWKRNFMRSGAVVDFLCRPFMTIEFDRNDGLPDGPALLAANHRSIADVFVAWICCYRLGRPTRFIVGRQFFKRPGMGQVLRMIGCIEGGRKSGADLIAIEAIEGGMTCAIMPEGAIKTMEPGKILAPLMPGVAEIWRKADCPLVVVGITGAGKVWGDGKYLPRMSLRPSRRPIVHVRLGDATTIGESGASLERVADLMEANCHRSAEAHALATKNASELA